MNCTYRAEELLAYVDNELPSVDIKAIEEHLAGCSHCRQEINELKNVTSLLNMLPDIEFSEDVRIRLSDKLREHVDLKETSMNNAPSFWKRWRILVPAVATCMCILFILATTQPQSQKTGNTNARPLEMAQRATLLLDQTSNVTVNGKRVQYNGKSSLLKLREDDLIAIGQGGHSKIAYPGDISIDLAPGSECRIYDRWIDLKRGNGVFKLAKQHKGFQVTTPTVTVTVIGTTFTVAVENDGASEVSLMEGIVEFETRMGKQTMSPGQTLKTTNAGSFNLRQTIQNVDNEILFKNGQRATSN